MSYNKEYPVRGCLSLEARKLLERQGFLPSPKIKQLFDSWALNISGFYRGSQGKPRVMFTSPKARKIPKQT